MPLSAGTRLGPYEILEPLGAGGMGEVYRAHDPRMGRDVAIKIAAERFNERFDREVRVVAGLNHPNVCHLYDVGPNYLVMELIEGPTLQERIRRGVVPLEEALPIARQIAEAVDAAHEKGIVHRDLKPGNIKLRPDGTVKVLDFGLAKVVEAATTDSSDLSHSPTLTIGTTGAGMILGTPSYMAPEQAKGRPVDKQADIWAFGVVLYEMLSGRKAFGGDDVSDILAAILRADVDWSALPASTPAHIRALLRRCLEKDPKRRLRDIGDARLDMDEPPPASPEPRSQQEVWLAWTLAAVATVLAVIAAIGWLRTGPTASAPAELALTIVPPSGQTLPPVGAGESVPEVSPDGTSVLYSASGRLFVRRLDSLRPQVLPGSEVVSNPPFWSSDSKFIVFPSPRGLTKMRLPDGAPEVVRPLPGFTRGGSWGNNGMILISSNNALDAVPASGVAAKLVDVAGKMQNLLYPEFLPGGDDFLFLAVGEGLEEGEIYLATLRDYNAANSVLLLKNDTAARYTPAGGGRILFVRNDNLYSQKLDLKARKLAGDPELVVAGVSSGPGQTIARADFSVSRNGLVAWRPGKAALSQVITFDRQGNVIGTTAPRARSHRSFCLPMNRGCWRLATAVGCCNRGSRRVPGWEPNGVGRCGLPTGRDSWALARAGRQRAKTS